MSLCQVFVNSSEPAAKRLKLDSEDVEVGSLVWARLPNSIWWPAMVEKKSDDHCYGVLFFDDECCLQSWNTPAELLAFTGMEDNIEGETSANGVDLREPLRRAVNLARTASTRSRAELAHALLLRNGLVQASGAAAATVPCLGMRIASDDIDAVAPRLVNDWAGHSSQWNASVPASPRREDHVEPAVPSVPNGPGEAFEHEVTRMLESDTESGGDEASSESDISAASSLASSYSTSGCSALYWEQSGDEAVVPDSGEAVCPEPGNTSYDAVVPWNLYADECDDDFYEDGDGDDDDDDGQGWPLSEAVVPAPCDASVGDDVNVEE